MAVYGPVRHKKKYYMDLRSFGPYNIFLYNGRRRDLVVIAILHGYSNGVLGRGCGWD
jgi:hypothetical protein